MHTDNSSGSIPDLVILALGELNQQFSNLVLHFHLAQDRRAIIRHGNFTIGRDEDFVESCALILSEANRMENTAMTSGTQGCSDDICHGTCGKDMGLAIVGTRPIRSK
jgi:hypothetical protein